MKLLVSDFDGTFYTDEKNININCKLIKKFIEEGNLFVLSSGRSYKSLTGKVKKYNIPYNFLSCCDGSFLFDKEAMLHVANTISHNVNSIFLPLANLKKHDRLEYAYLDDYYEQYDNKKMLASVALTINEKNIDKEFVDKFNEVKERHPEYQYDIYGYNGIYYYLIRPIGVSKALPIKYLEEKYNLSKNDIYTIGDNTNDYELIRDYNGYRIGDNKDIISVSIEKYDSVHELVNDILHKKVKKRF